MSTLSRLPIAAGFAGPWSSIEQFALVRVAFPVVVISAAVLFMSPGLLLIRASHRVTGFGSWLLLAVPPCLLIAACLTIVSRHILGRPVGGRELAIATIVIAGLCAIGAEAVARRRKGLPPQWRLSSSNVLPAIVIPLVLLSVWAPKFLWEDFNGDGVHAFEASRLLLTQAWPFFPPEAGDVASFPGLTSMLFAYPNGWFLGLFGEFEASVRVPFALYLCLVASGVHALAGEGGRRLPTLTIAAVWSSLIVYAMVIGFSATYSPYNADFALPATQDTLLVVCFLGFVHALIGRSWVWAAMFAILTYVSLPSGLLLLGFWMIADVIVVRPRWMRTGALLGLMVVGIVVASAAVTYLIAAAGSSPPGAEYGARKTLQDLMLLHVTDVRRFAYVLIPGGIFPALAILLWRRQDDVARRISLVVIMYVGFFYVQSRISLHHFVPAMLLPIAVAARVIPLDDSAARRWSGAWIAAAAAAFIVSLPGTFRISTLSRAVGSSITQQVGDYGASEPAVFAATPVLDRLFPADWDPGVPDSGYGGSPLVWLHYASVDVSHAIAKNYLLMPANSDAPPHSHLLAQDASAALYVRSESVMTAHRALRPIGRTAATLYMIPQRALFSGRRGWGTIDVAAILRRAGINVAGMPD